MYSDDYFMEFAIIEAKKALECDEIPVGVVIVKNNIIIAKAFNTRNKTNIIYHHAEMNAIKKANIFLNNWRLDNCILYTTLEPCPMCASAIEQCRIKKIVIGASSGNVCKSKLTESILENIEVVKNVKKDKCSRLIKDFFYNKRKQKIFSITNVVNPKI